MLTFSSLGRYGRFANQMFQIAGTIGLALKHGHSFAFPEWKNYDHAERFGSSEDIDLQKYFVNPLPQIAGDYPHFTKKEYPWGYHDINLPPGNWDLAGHFQSEKYFKHCIHLVRHYFRMKEEKPIPQAVAIHVRLGDYDNRYHPRLGLEFYAEAMQQFPKGTCFKLFSDEPRTALSLLSEQSDYIFLSEGKTYIDDFRLMKGCGSFITGNSSFSLMAAILGEAPDKKIICPRKWFGPAWTIPMETKDIYPENSIVI